jgi:hypothetical protein
MPNGFSKWVFTYNNYTEDQYQFIVALADKVHYIIVGKEVGESGTPHLQGFVCLKERKSLVGVKRFLGNDTIHVEVAKSPADAAEYCKKEGSFVEFGTVPKQGKRNDLEEFKIAVKNGTHLLKDVRENHSEVYAKYPRFCLEYLDDHCTKHVLEMFQLRRWQVDLNTKLNREPDTRTIIFIVDLVGNTGKSWFCDYYQSIHSNVQILQPAKKVDMVYALDVTSRVIFLDCPRAKSECIHYDLLEECKNGRVFSSKYESRMKRLGKVHVVCMMNEEPDKYKLSGDRYDVVRLTVESNRV